MYLPSAFCDLLLRAPICARRSASTRATCRIHTCDMTHISAVCILQLARAGSLCVFDVTHAYVRRDSFIHMTWLMYLPIAFRVAWAGLCVERVPMCVRHKVFICRAPDPGHRWEIWTYDKWLVHMCDVIRTFDYVAQRACIDADHQCQHRCLTSKNDSRKYSVRQSY